MSLEANGSLIDSREEEKAGFWNKRDKKKSENKSLFFNLLY